MTKHRYAVILEQGEDGYIVAHVPALRGVISQGKTRQEALNNIQEAIELHLETLRALNEPIPQEATEFVEVVA
ncbi:MAG: type II toxin-antitoxin system HicB family antitoxin [Chloroflexi bacterium]|nr:type II toxin-antitoxin system HicB family antitoxin [Chloroflexota bacterium]